VNNNKTFESNQNHHWLLRIEQEKEEVEKKSFIVSFFLFPSLKSLDLGRFVAFS